jgi:hypothetical protein
MTILQQINTSDSPLYTNEPQLLERYNRDLPRYEELTKASSVTAEDLDPAKQLLCLIGSKLQKKHYQYGCIGGTGAGKSTTLNNLIDRKVFTGGSGDATSAVSTRIVRNSGPLFSRVFYLTPTQWPVKREALCKAVGLDPEKTDTELIKEATVLEQRLRNGPTDDDSNGNGFALADVQMLIWVISSYRQYGNEFVKEPAHFVDPTLDNLGTFLNHPRRNGGPPEASHQALIATAEIAVDSDAIPFTVAYFDLPGLLSACQWDSVLTETVLSNLDGWLFFLRADQLSDAKIDSLIRIASVQRGPLGSPLQVVLTKCDSWTDDHYTGTPDVANAIVNFLTRNNLQPQQISFVSNEVYREWVRVPETERTQVPLRILRRPVNQPIPPCFQPYPESLANYQQLLRDGGIANLRHVVRTKLCPRVEDGLRHWLSNRLDKLERELGRLEHRAKPISEDHRPLLIKARNAVLKLHHRFYNDPNFRRLTLEPRAKECSEFLEERFLGNCLDGSILALMTPAQLDGEFQQHSRLLDKILPTAAEVKLFHPLADFICQQLAAVPTVAVNGSNSIQEAWMEECDKETTQGARRIARWPTFAGQLFGDVLPSREGGLKGEDYQELMLEKIRVVVYSVTHLTIAQLADLLTRLDALIAKSLTN